MHRCGTLLPSGSTAAGHTGDRRSPVPTRPALSGALAAFSRPRGARPRRLPPPRSRRSSPLPPVPSLPCPNPGPSQPRQSPCAPAASARARPSGPKYRGGQPERPGPGEGAWAGFRRLGLPRPRPRAPWRQRPQALLCQSGPAGRRGPRRGELPARPPLQHGSKCRLRGGTSLCRTTRQEEPPSRPAWIRALAISRCPFPHAIWRQERLSVSVWRRSASPPAWIKAVAISRCPAWHVIWRQEHLSLFVLRKVASQPALIRAVSI
jgi:hypothetical protein